jgi:hypothetical protein
MIGKACHHLDTGDSGPYHECHEIGHANDAAQCFAKGRECLDLCNAADGGTHGDGGTHLDSGMPKDGSLDVAPTG